MPRRATFLGLVGTLVCRAASGAPTASETELARTFYRSAIAAETAGQWKDAAAELERAIAIKPTATLRLHLATCLEHLGRLVETSLEYDRALELLDGDADATDVLATVRQKRAALDARIPTITLRLSKDVADADLAVDGQHVSRSVFGHALPLNPGDHEISVTSFGRRPYAKRIELQERSALVETIEMPPVVETQAGVLTVAPAPPAAASTPTPARWQRTVVVAGEALVAAVGAGLLIGSRVEASAAASRINTEQAVVDGMTNMIGYSCWDPPQRLRVPCADLSTALADRQAADRLGAVGAIMLVVGGVAGAATWLLWSTEGTQTHIIERVGVRPSGHGILLEGAF